MSNPEQPPATVVNNNHTSNQGAQGVFNGPTYISNSPPPPPAQSSWLARLIGRFSRYTHDYHEHFLANHRFLDLKGLKTWNIHPELTSVFIEPYLGLPKLANQVSPDPLHQVSETVPEAPRTIWTFLQGERWRSHCIVLLGAPGSGKTTILQHLGLSLIPAWRQQDTENSPIPRLSSRLPILLFLREHAVDIEKNKRFSLVDAVLAGLPSQQQKSSRKEWIERELDAGQCLVLLDGLDEVADEKKRQAVVEWVNCQIRAYHRNRFIITSRPHGYRDHPLERGMVLEIHPFTQKQIRRFLHAWYHQDLIQQPTGKDDPEVGSKARKAAEDLFALLRHNPNLHALTVNPLLLTMLVTVHCYHETQLPDSRAALYQEICTAFLGKRRQARKIDQTLRADQRQVVLQTLAYEMMQQEIQEIRQDPAQKKIKGPLQRVQLTLDPAHFLQEIEQESGLLLQRKSGIYKFAHVTFQEYLAAVYIEKHHLEEELVARVAEKEWREVILLYCAANDASALIKACLQQAGTSTYALELAIDCDKEAQQVEQEVKKELHVLLQEGVESSNAQRRQIVASVLLSRRSRHMVRLGEETYRDTSLVTCGEYQLFLDEQPTQRKPDHWLERRFPSSQGNAPVLGVREEQARAFVTWLTQREQGFWQYDLPRVEELNGQEATILFPPGTGCWCQEGKFYWSTKVPNLPSVMLRELSEKVFPYPLDLSDQLNKVRHIIGSAEHARVQLARFDNVSARPPRDLRPWTQELDGAVYKAEELAEKLKSILSSLEAQSLRRGCLLALAVALAFSTENTSQEDLYPLARTLISSHISVSIQEPPLSFHLDSRHLVRGLTERLNQIEKKRLVKEMLDLYLNLAILEGRIQGRLPVHEGILLVKEQKQL